jgi:geranylgeranyl diphosphate synthase type II
LSGGAVETLEHYLETWGRRVDEELEQILPGAEEAPASIHRAMRHSVFAGGKRLRPILCLESGRLFGGDEASLLHAACALELIHTYSLIHDDLPALDNDDLRRGQPTCHKAFGEALAILAGDALLTLAYEVLSTPGLFSAGRQVRLIHELSHAIGTLAGMVGGQVVDLETSGATADAATVDYIHAAKTGAFILAAVRCGALGAGASDADLGRVSEYGRRIGLAFQIADDLLDVLGSQEAMGKTLGKDERQQKATYPAVHGVEKSKKIAQQLVTEACEALAPFGPRARRLQEIAQFMIARTT